MARGDKVSKAAKAVRTRGTKGLRVAKKASGGQSRIPAKNQTAQNWLGGDAWKLEAPDPRRYQGFRNWADSSFDLSRGPVSSDLIVEGVGNLKIKGVVAKNVLSTMRAMPTEVGLPKADTPAQEVGTVVLRVVRFLAGTTGQEEVPVRTEVDSGRRLRDFVLVSDNQVEETLGGDSRMILGYIQEILDLNGTEFAGLFGLTRRAVEKWRDGIPSERAEKVVAIYQIARLLDQHLRSELIPGIVRTPAKAYGDRSILDLVQAGEHQRALKLTEQGFDYAGSV